MGCYLLGVLCERHPEHVAALLGLWADPNLRVKKQVVDSLGLLLRHNPALATSPEVTEFLNELESVQTLRNLSLAAGRVLRLPRRKVRRGVSEAVAEEEADEIDG